ncbi:hypothetical protein EBU24_03000 [bacterium]|nr:hypothetical protein [bacterium]
MCGNSFQIKKIFGENDILRLWNYDSWACRMSWWTNLQTYNISNFPQTDPMLWFGFWIPPKGSAPMKINSGFGGMTIYKTKFYLIGNYSGVDCEHVTFHYDIVKKNSKFNLFLNPSQVMLMS